MKICMSICNFSISINVETWLKLQMDFEAATDEIPSKALSCSPLIEISNLLEEFENFIMVWLQWKTGLKESRMSLSRKMQVLIL